MMAWNLDRQHHQMSHGWRVSALIDAFLELILFLCVFLCAMISITTTRLLKSSGLFLHQTCLSCDVHHEHNRHRRQGGYKHDVHMEGNQKLDAMNVVCENCTLCLSKCEYTVRREYLLGNAAPGVGRCRFNVASVNDTNPRDCVVGHTITDDCVCQKRCGRSCGSFENVDYSSDGTSDNIEFDDATTIKPYGCECGIGGQSRPNSESRSLKRKFAKVFHNDSRGVGSPSCWDHPNPDSGGSPSVMRSGKRSAEANQVGAEDGLLIHMGGSSSRFPSDSSGDADHHYRRRFFPEDSVRDSSQESFSYTNPHSSQKFSLYEAGAETSESTVKLSVDTDLLAGESTPDSTPEWCGSSASPHALLGKEMEVAGSRVHEEDRRIGMTELREALREEQDASAALYLELEEERNAASSAAHEAMAMITRLQEEKAAIRMEARQYQRMAEEKQQYDQESMTMLQGILVKKDHEVYALEEELNLCRKRLLTLGLDGDGGGRDRVGSSPRRGNDVLLIEQETLLLEGSEDWKNRRDRRDEKLLAEIKNWLHEANKKVAAERIGESNDPGNFQKSSSNMNRLLPGNGKKNLLDSFSSVAAEDSRRDEIADEELEVHLDGIVTDEIGILRKSRSVEFDEIVNEEFQVHLDEIANDELEAVKDIIELEIQGDGVENEDNETRNESAAGYESFQGMMESLKQQPRLRDEESLKTLKKIEEKFRRQSSKGEVRTGDELRQIWKNILKSFESDERMDADVHERGRAEVTEQNATIHVEPVGTGDKSGQNEVGHSVDTDRSVGEKRISVLEYVSKFEEQLHQLGNKKPRHAGKLVSSTIESVAEIPPESKGASLEVVDADKKRRTSLVADRTMPIKTRLRNVLSADGRSTIPDAERNSFVVREEATRTQDARFEEEGNEDGSSVVHDIYEVQDEIYRVQEYTSELLTDVSSKGRIDIPVSHEMKKCVSSSVNELVHGQSLDSHETARCVEHYLSESGRLDYLAGQEEHDARGKGIPNQKIRSRSGNFSLFVKDEPANFWHVDKSSESERCDVKPPSDVVTNSPEIVLQDVVQQLTRRLHSLETDRVRMQDTIASLKREDYETKHLQDIAQHLRELTGTEQTAVTNKDTWPSDDSAVISLLKTDASVPSQWQSWRLPRTSGSELVPTPSELTFLSTTETH